MSEPAAILGRLRSALGLATAGLLIGALCHPTLASLLAAAIGETPRRALSLPHLRALALNHLALAASGLALTAALGVGLGILATREAAASLRGAVDTLAAAAQAVPPVVVVALALPVLGFGGPPTLLALVFYGVMPVLRGTTSSIEAVSPETREAAQAIGLTRAQILTRVEIPLAAPGIIEALRTALVLAVATVAVGALAGAPTLGTPVVAGLQNQNMVPMLQGTAATAALAFLCDALMLALAALVRR
ncbi:ABC transporter permease subunit [Methylobacterium durans]|uniref:ABC transporter permease n=1 Tax=Methylobacterium durans TaxID=2202825 RepID=UPI002AFE46FD|nr:ABC transporter permease subunit [Methylobacterium durans]MEA1830736.1 ABC transporter permease subunit [Methylobacterium durans]